MPRTSDEVFIWIPYSYLQSRWAVIVDGVDVISDLIEAKFTKSLSPEIGYFKMVLDNNNGTHSGVYVSGEEVELRYDFIDGTTTRFKGFIEEVKDQFKSATGHTVEIVGSHVAGDLLNMTVSKEYDGSQDAGNVIVDLISSYAPVGFTTNNVSNSGVFPKIKFNEVPLWKAISDVVKVVGDFDLYVDDDKDVHFFKETSVKNDDVAVVQGDNLVELDGLGFDVVNVRNKVRVIGESNGLPVIWTESDSESATNLKERIHVINNTDVTDEDIARSIAQGKLRLLKKNFESGGGMSLILPQLKPGDFSFISSLVHKIHGRFRFVKFTHSLPDGFTEFEVEDGRA